MTDFNTSIEVSYTVDSQSAIQSLSEIRDTMSDVQGSAQELDSALASGFAGDKAIDALTDAINKLGDSIEDAKDKTEDLSKEEKKGEEQTKKTTKATDALGRSLTVTGGKGRKFGRILRLLAATPLLATVTLIVGALAFLGRRFASTEEGANKLEKISTILSSVFGFLADKVIGLGTELVAAFESPQEAIGTLVTSIKTRVVNLVKGLGQLFAGLGDVIIATFTLDPEGVESASERMKTAISDIGQATGISSLPEIFQETKKEMEAVVEQAKIIADEAGKAADQLAAVEKTERKLALSRAKLNTQLVKTRALANDNTKSLQERLAAIEKIEKAEKRQLAAEISAQRKRIAAIAKLNSLNESGKDDLDKLNEARIKLSNLQAQSEQRLIAFQEKKNSLEKQAIEEVKKAVELETEIRLSLIEDQEKRAIQAAKNEADALKEKINTIIGDETKRAELIKGVEQNLQREITNITNEGIQRRAREARERQNKALQEELAKVNLALQIKRLELEKKLELQRQEYAQEERTAEEIKAFKTRQANEIANLEIEAQIKRLETLKQFNKELTAEQKRQLDAELELLRAQQAGIGIEIEKEADGRIEILGENVKAIQSAATQALSAVSDAVKAREQVLQREVSTREKRISELESQLEKEKALAAEGKENQVAQVEARIKEEKAARDAAQKEKEQAAKTAFILDTAIQTSNLVTAISGLYSTLSTLPFGIGVAVATALSAVMIGAFVASKASAASAAGFYEGGDTGGHNPKKVSTRLGQRPYEVHEEEWVIPHKLYRKHRLRGMPIEVMDKVLGRGLQREWVTDMNYKPFGNNSTNYNQISEKFTTLDAKSQLAMDNTIVLNQNKDNAKMEEWLRKIYNKPTVYSLPDGKVVTITNGKKTVKKH